MSTVAGHYTPPPGDLLTGLYGAFFEPARAGSAAFFQVSPLSFFALLRRGSTGISARDARLLAFFALAAALVVLAYARSLPGMSADPGFVPDMRYLSPAYLPLLVMGSMPSSTRALTAMGWGRPSGRSSGSWSSTSRSSSSSSRSSPATTPQDRSRFSCTSP
ncbi:hypothetical protein ACK11Z_11890, partial [Methanoculleus bourgensis]